MAKMTRTKLKGIVKECLMEILAEGLDSGSAKSKSVSRKKKQNTLEEKRLAEHRKKFEYRVDDTVSGLTDDPVMASIFKDTAATTLQEQYDSRGGSSPLADPAHGAGVSLDGLFGNATVNWEKLAFESKTPGK